LVSFPFPARRPGASLEASDLLAIKFDNEIGRLMREAPLSFVIGNAITLRLLKISQGERLINILAGYINKYINKFFIFSRAGERLIYNNKSTNKVIRYLT